MKQPPPPSPTGPDATLPTEPDPPPAPITVGGEPAALRGITDAHNRYRAKHCDEEIHQYDFAHQGFSVDTGHFTQVVWRGTQRVGCGFVACDGGRTYVCNYDPPGNWRGNYEHNVLPLPCKR